jgi:hypothetical protein
MADAQDIMEAIRDEIKGDSTLAKWAQTLRSGTGRISYALGRDAVDPGNRPTIFIEDVPEWEFTNKELNSNDRDILQLFVATIVLPDDTTAANAETFVKHILRIIRANDTLDDLIFDITPIDVSEPAEAENYDIKMITFETQRA